MRCGGKRFETIRVEVGHADLPGSKRLHSRSCASCGLVEFNRTDRVEPDAEAGEVRVTIPTGDPI